MSRQRLTLITGVALVLIGDAAFAQQHDHEHAAAATPLVQDIDNEAALLPHAQHGGEHAAAATVPAPTHEVEHAMHHEEMNHEEMNHEEMNHEAMDHEEMNHEAMNHEEMNHDAMNHEAMNHEEMGNEATGQNMDHAAMDQPGQAELRDPHAYSNGYERTSGPYALPDQRQVVLADEEMFAGLWMDRLEFVQHDVTEGAELEGFAWFGNSYRQVVVQAQIETVEGTVEEGEVDLLYSQAVAPFWDLRVGLHRSFGANADRDWAAIGFKGLAPYWFEIDATLHLGDSGHAALDFEAEYELLLTQRLALQPRIDIGAFSKTDVELGRGSGLSVIKVGARLRYEIDRRFAPYVGVERVNRFGETADLLPQGVDRTETHWVLGLRFWL